MNGKYLTPKVLKIICLGLVVVCVFSTGMWVTGNSDLKAECNALQAQLEDADETILKSKNTISENEIQIQNLETQLDALEDQSAKIEELNDKIKEQSTVIENLNAEADEVQSGYEALKAEHEKCGSKITELTTQISKIKAEQEQSINVSSNAAAEDDNNSGEAVEETVHVTKTGNKYHRGGCRYLKQSDITISLSNAQAQGYSSCSVCY